MEGWQEIAELVGILVGIFFLFIYIVPRLNIEFS